MKMTEKYLMINGIVSGNKVYCPEGSDLYKQVEADPSLEVVGVGEDFMNAIALMGIAREVEMRDIPTQSGLVDLIEMARRASDDGE